MLFYHAKVLLKDFSISFKLHSAHCGLASLITGQEEYDEHHSEVTQCRFSHSGTTIASSDVDGVVKVWSASPGPPHTVKSKIIAKIWVSQLLRLSMKISYVLLSTFFSLFHLKFCSFETLIELRGGERHCALDQII